MTLLLCTAVNAGFSCGVSNVVLLWSVTAALSCGVSIVVVCVCGMMTGLSSCVVVSCVIFFNRSGLDNI